MKKILTLVLCGAAMSLGAHAQLATPAPSASPADQTAAGAHGKHGGHAGLLKHLTEELALTQDQQDKIKPILEGFRTEVQGIMQGTGDKKDNREKIRAAREKMVADVNATLTPDQQAKYATLRENMKQRHEAKKAGEAPAAPSATAAPSVSGT